MQRHLFALYLKSGSSKDEVRKRALKHTLKKCKAICEKDPAALIFMLGDLNMKGDRLDIALTVNGGIMKRTMKGSTVTRQVRVKERGKNRWTIRRSDIDHCAV